MDKKSININGYSHIAYEHQTISEKEMIQKSNEYLNWLNERRSVREFSSKPIPKEIIENLILSASTAPSGAHKQPWFFCVITSKEMKRKVREAAEKEEYENYNGRMSEDWLKDLEKFDTNWEKPFLEIAPALIVVFKKTYELDEKGKSKNYYVNDERKISYAISNNICKIFK